MGADHVDEQPVLHGPVDPTRAVCGVCSAVGIGFVADVRYFPGDALSVPRPLLLCARCRALIATGNRFVLTTVLSPALAECGRDRMATYLLHHVSRVIPAAAPPPELQRLREQGFELLADHTAAVDEVADAWPGEHAVALPDPHPDMSTAGPVWLVRSPWPALALVEVFEALWCWVEREGTGDGEGDAATRRTRIAEVFAWDEAHARGWLDLSRDA